MKLNHKYCLILIISLITILSQGNRMLAEEPVVSLNLKNNTEETVYWLLAFEETDAMDGTLKEKLGNWIPSRVFELDGPEMTIVFTSVVADEGKTTFNLKFKRHPQKTSKKT